MDSRTILVPVIESSTAAEISRNAFWLALSQPASLQIIEIIPPQGFIRWLFTPVVNLIKGQNNNSLLKVQQKAKGQRELSCEVAQFRAPSLTLGIIEAARAAQPYMLVLFPEVYTCLRASAVLGELKKRLSEINDCVLVIIKNDRSWRIEPCIKKTLTDFKQVIPIDIHKWVV